MDLTVHVAKPMINAYLYFVCKYLSVGVQQLLWEDAKTNVSRAGQMKSDNVVWPSRIA